MASSSRGSYGTGQGGLGESLIGQRLLQLYEVLTISSGQIEILTKGNLKKKLYANYFDDIIQIICI